MTLLRNIWDFFFKQRTCVPDGCGFQEPNALDDKCLICRLPMGLPKINLDDSQK